MTVTIRDVRKADGAAMVAANVASAELHFPWVEPFQDIAGFRAWFAGIASGRRRSFLIEQDGRLAGVINLNEIVRGPFLSAYLGYYALAGGAGRGMMTSGLSQVIVEAFGPMGLHRLEANIQPANARSIALVRRLGFRLEGYSPRYLKIAGDWRDHERWARLCDDDVASAVESF
ncbi:MAG: GNAT family N-acetyltransferase [Alphaproteobacteria bacterium]|nr:GNAT family N-acetyltransferase [Alphaproteobacteria bacterium]